MMNFGSDLAIKEDENLREGIK